VVNQSRVLTQYVAEGPSGKFPVMSLSKLKSIAGGSDAEGYKAWRTTYDPEPIKVKKDLMVVRLALKATMRSYLVSAGDGLLRPRRFVIRPRSAMIS
jgi:hypothetical protein